MRGIRVSVFKCYAFATRFALLMKMVYQKGVTIYPYVHIIALKLKQQTQRSVNGLRIYWG